MRLQQLRHAGPVLQRHNLSESGTANYQCAARSGACCESCMFVSAASKVCQTAVDECDLAEYGPGGTDEGPKDGYFYPGKTCTREGYSGLVYGGRCESLTHRAQGTSTVTSMETGT